MMNKKKIQRLLRLSFFRKMKLYHLVRFYARQDRMERIVKKNGGNLKELRPFLKEAMVVYHWDFDEFFMYNYLGLTREERMSFVPEYEKNVFCDKVNDYKASGIFDSKWETYKVFSSYFKRECVLVLPDSDWKTNPSVLSFFKRNAAFMLKPDSDASGRGISMVSSRSVEDAVFQVSEIIKGRKGRFILEELIQQHSEMAKYNPSSVNSLRIRTFRFDNRVSILPSNMRLGRAGSVVDNTGKGGISVALYNDGLVESACDEDGIFYSVHPDTGVPILESRVPLWDEALSLAQELAMVVPSVRYVGWDLALTNDGWVMIEGNDKGMFVGIQKPRQKGFRPALNSILSEMHISL